MKLYGYWRSSSTWRVRIALAYKGIPHAYEAVNLRAGEQHAERYDALNPMHTVPLLEVEEDGEVRRISQSMAIIEYLEERHPEPALLPGGPLDRAFIRELAEVVNSGIQPFQNMQVLKKVKHEMHGDDFAWARHWIARGLDALERRVAGRAGPFCAGGVVSLADVYLVPQLYSARRFGVELSSCPTLTRIEAACEALPAFQQAHADRQPDAVK